MNGTCMVNFYKLDAWSKWEMTACSLRKYVSGDHIQLARTKEMEESPQIPKLGGSPKKMSRRKNSQNAAKLNGPSTMPVPVTVPAAVTLKSARLLPRSFFERHPRIVARQLLGKLLVRRSAGLLLAGRIVETEAYLGSGDDAAHAASGKTARSSVLFGPAGHAYVYFTYGMHHCMNVSCEREGRAGCVLLRALEPVAGFESMAIARGLASSIRDARSRAASKNLRLLASGPGRLCQALGITRNRDNGKDLLAKNSDLVLMRMDAGVRLGRILTSQRIGIRRSMELPLRFLLAENPFISRK